MKQNTMNRRRLANVQPFELCSIRPPTENDSLTFRLTRNCYWNKCGFCPIYKTGATFSKRSVEEVWEDIANAAILDDLITCNGAGGKCFGQSFQERALSLIDQLRQVKREAGVRGRERSLPLENSPDPRMRWFSGWFIEYPDIVDCIKHVLAWRLAGGRTCFLGDADSLILKPDYLEKVLTRIRVVFPGITRFTIYGRTRTAAAVRSLKDLRAFRGAGIDRVHFGIESGSAAVLEMVNKGETPDDHIEGTRKAAEAGLSCSFYVMPGLGGVSLSEEHALETARVINASRPEYVRIRTLEIFDGTPLDAMRRAGTFVETDDDETVREIRTMIEAIDTPVDFLSDSATNLLSLFGRLPEDRTALCSVIDTYLARDSRERAEFSLRSRLEAFEGQYGGLSREVLGVLAPVISENRLDLSRASEETLKEMTAFVKSRLMP